MWVRVLGVGVVAGVVLAGCGGGTDDDDAVGASEAVDEGSVAPTADPTAASGGEGESVGDGGTADDEAPGDGDGDGSTGSVAVDPGALPTGAVGLDAFVDDPCGLYAVEELDAYFLGAGGLAVAEPLDEGCRWVVEGLPRSHFVTVQTTGEETVFGILEGDRVDVAGTEVHLQQGPADAYATFAAADGQLLLVVVHGDFDVDGRALDGALDEAALGLAENVIGRV